MGGWGEEEWGAEGIAAEGAGLGHEFLEEAEVAFVDASGGGGVADGDPGGFADDFPHHATGAHDTDGAEGFAVDADVAAGHEEVFDIAAIEGAVGGPVDALVAEVIARGGDGDELLAFKALAEGRVWGMEVDVPGAGEAAIGEGAALAEVVAGEDDIAEEAAGLAFAGDEGGPLEAVGGVEVVDVLQGVPGAVHGAEIEVADTFDIANGVLIEATFPEPAAEVAEGATRPLAAVVLAAWEGFIGEVDGPGASWEGGLGEAGLDGEGEGVLVFAFAEEDLGGVGGVEKVPEVAGAHLGFLGHFVIGAGQGADGGVPGAVGEEGGGEAELAGGADMLRDDGEDAALAGLDSIDVVFEEEGDAGFCADEVEFAGVVVDVAGFGITGGGGSGGDEFFDDVTDMGVGGLAGFAFGPDADFGAGVAAEDGAVLDEGDGEALAGGGEGGRGAGDASADDNEVEGAGVIGFGGEAEGMSAEGGEGGGVVGRGEIGLLAEEDGIAASLEAGEVVEGDRGLGIDVDVATVLPMPIGALGAESGGQGGAVDEELESARGARDVPGCDPVTGSDPDPVAAGAGEGGGGGGVADGDAEAMGEEVGRAHLVHGLLVEVPAAEVGELFGLEEKGVGGGGAEEGCGGEEGNDRVGAEGGEARVPLGERLAHRYSTCIWGRRFDQAPSRDSVLDEVHDRSG